MHVHEYVYNTKCIKYTCIYGSTVQKGGGGKIGAIIPDSIKEVFSVVVVVENRPKGRLERVK